MTQSAPRRPRRRWIAPVVWVVGAVVTLGVVGELVLRGVIDDRIESTAADLPSGLSVARDDTPALWQVATGRATLRVEVTPDGLTDIARTATDLPALEVTPESGSLVARVPLAIAGDEQMVDVLLAVAAEDGQAVLRADTVRFAGLTLPVATLAEQLDNTQLDQLAEGMVFPEGTSEVAISSARATDDGLELGAEVAMW
jgi:hypothetical protein